MTSYPVARMGAVLLCAGLLSAGARAHEGHVHPEPGAQQTVAGSGVAATLKATRLPDGAVFVPKPAQFRLGLKSVPAVQASAGSTLRLEAMIVPDPARSARIASTERGVFEPVAGNHYRLGGKVARGTLLGHVRPLLDEAERIRRRADLARTEQELIINEQGLAQLGMQLKGQPGMSSTTLYHDNLMRDRERIQVKLREVKRSLEARTPLVTPVAGEISEVRARHGTLVDTGETVFEVIDPAHLWVEAQSYETLDPATIARAEARTRSGQVLAVRYVGQNRTASDQSLPLEFELGAHETDLRVGERVELLLTLAGGEGMVLPSSSLARGEDGATRVWVQAGAERFVRRTLETTPLPGGRVVVRAGLDGGERVVTQGGWLLDQIR